MNADVIAARRQHIQDSAPCEGCGATLADCKANRGKDPTAPEWFGCCSQGGPCTHTPDRRALLALLKEIESGQVSTVEEVTAPKARRERVFSWFAYLNQRTTWYPKGRPPVRIADMDAEWRYNASRFLERRAARVAVAYELSEALWFEALCASPLGPSESAQDALEAQMDQDFVLRHQDPAAWIRTTPLYEELVSGLPRKRKKLARLAERARHHATCPVRRAANKPACCGGSGFADYAAVPCPAPDCPVGRPCTCPKPVVPEWTLS